VAAPAALAQPANDDFANATVVTTVPFRATEDTTQATSDPIADRRQATNDRRQADGT
jgi:hypothetical protein